MDTMTAFAMGMANKDKEMMVFDWEKAARVIVELQVKNAQAGLAGDWEYTGGNILANGEVVPSDETSTYLASTWAAPELCIDGVTIDCYRMCSETPGWDAETYWPPEALDILNGAACHQ
jgi:hypothetical protein